MALVIVAVGAGVLAGWIRGGSLLHLSRPLRWWGLAATSLAALFVVAVLPDLPDAALWNLAAQVGLALVALRNLLWAGMGILLVGAALNVAVVAANGAMPVDAGALVTAGVVEDYDVVSDGRAVAVVDPGPGRVLVGRPGDDAPVLGFLGDTIPIATLGLVVSFGDLVIATGLAVALAYRMNPPRLPRTFIRVAGGTSAMVSEAERIRRQSNATPVHDWGADPPVEPVSGSQNSARPDAAAPARRARVRPAAASASPWRLAPTESR